ncbi:trypsin-like peptidase domain-containing protein [Streptomyces sp. NPDC051776]|uniref:S1C family serine protease n=1 Tax=Streptomyces sp. NPDC051776 TaxID=3155414 RepID=UPI00341F2B8B
MTDNDAFRNPYQAPRIPERPRHEPPVAGPGGVTIWPGGGGPAPVGPGGSGAAPGGSGSAGAPPGGPGSAGVGDAGSRGVIPSFGGSHRRARKPVALIAAVAILAAGVGGGTALFVDHLAAGTGDGRSNSVAGTFTSNSVPADGTVASVASAVGPSVVEITATSPNGRSTGSGVITTADGEILTNNHVISGASSIKIRFSDGKTATAEVVGTDPDLDMALVKARNVSGLKPAALGDSDQVKVGDEVVAIGSPEGLSGTVTSGIISALDREVTVQKEDGDGRRPGSGDQWPFEFGGGRYNGDVGESTTTYKALQTDASLNPGNSGGALVNMRGQIIGINSAMYAPASATGGQSGSAGSIGLGFAIPVNDVKKILDDLRDGGSGG